MHICRFTMPAIRAAAAAHLRPSRGAVRVVSDRFHRWSSSDLRADGASAETPTKAPEPYNPRMEQLRKWRDAAFRSYTQELRIGAVTATSAVNEGLKRFDIQHPGLQVLYARAAVAALLLSTFLKGEERVQMQIIARTGLVQEILVESMGIGELRGYLRAAPLLELPPASEPIYVEPGSVLRVSKILYNHAKPVDSFTELLMGDITSDINNYFLLSDQLPSHFHAETILKPQGGGFEYVAGCLAQQMPQSSPAALKSLVQQLDAQPNFLHHWTEHAGLPAVGAAMARASGHPQVSEQNIEGRRIPIHYFCRCSHKKCVDALASLPIAQLQEMRTEAVSQPHAMTCKYCNTVHNITAADLEGLMKAQAERSTK